MTLLMKYPWNHVFTYVTPPIIFRKWLNLFLFPTSCECNVNLSVAGWFIPLDYLNVCWSHFIFSWTWIITSWSPANTGSGYRINVVQCIHYLSYGNKNQAKGTREKNLMRSSHLADPRDFYSKKGKYKILRNEVIVFIKIVFSIGRKLTE